MSDTPRTDAVLEYDDTNIDDVKDFARQLERELNAANVEMEERRKDIVYLATEKAKLEDRINRLEKAGDEMAQGCVNSSRLAYHWCKAKEYNL
jgi:archaellum component FlaC